MGVGVIDRAGRAFSRTEHSPWMERLGRLGLCSRGAIYSVVAVLAVQVAVNGSGKVDRQGALQAVADESFGQAVIVLLCVGFAGYAAWRFAKAAVGAGEGSGHEDGAKGLVKRAADVGRGLIYVTLLYSAIRLLAGGQPSGGSDKEAKTWSARLMTHGAGRGLVIAAGAGLVVTGVVLLVRALEQKFEKHLKMGDMGARGRTWYPRLGTFGYAARGVVAALVGVFIVQAGVTFDPKKAVGIDGALKKLAGQTYGPLALGLIAAGLLAFGLYSFVEARYRRVLDG